MKIVIFGLSVSSSWGYGHATLWRGLIRALSSMGHRVVFFERDVPYYAAHRDLTELEGEARLILYSDWHQIAGQARAECDEADAAMVTSYCPDALAATELAIESRARSRVFYDLDTPVTLERVQAGEKVSYIGPRGLQDFDRVLSFTGGKSLEALQNTLGAKKLAPLYGSVDPQIHRSTIPQKRFECELSYLGTYAQDRQQKLEKLFIHPCRHSGKKFILGGSMFPSNFPWVPGIHYLNHVAPSDHPAFYSSSRITLNLTRAAMAKLGYCPSGRLFEAAACRTPILSDSWEGLEQFFTPGSEILIARESEDTLRALDLSDRELGAIAQRAFERTMDEHTAMARAKELERLLETARAPTLPEKSEPIVELRSRARTWGIIPAAGMGSRIRPLAFSKELLPVGSRMDGTVERPRAVTEYLLDRMIDGGATQICFVISPGKFDIMEYFGGSYRETEICYTIQPKAAGLCDALFRSASLIGDDDEVLIGLPDTVWFPEDGFNQLERERLSFLLFPVDRPEYFDAVVLDDGMNVLEIQVKKPNPSSSWVWGAFKMPGRVFRELHRLWLVREKSDEYMGTLVNAFLAQGGRASGVRAGVSYVDVGTLHGYREAIQSLSKPRDSRLRSA